MTRIIGISTRLGPGHGILVDDEDYDFLNQWTWHSDGRYAKRSRRKADPPGAQAVFLHKVVLERKLGRTTDLMGDHVNRKTFDNRSSNLREANRLQQNANVSKVAGTSVYRGERLWIAELVGGRLR